MTGISRRHFLPTNNIEVTQTPNQQRRGVNHLERKITSLRSQIASVVNALGDSNRNTRVEVLIERPVIAATSQESSLPTTVIVPTPDFTRPSTPALGASRAQEIPLNQAVSSEHVEQAPVAELVASTCDTLPSNAANTDIPVIPVLPLAPDFINYTELDKPAAAPAPSKDSVNPSGKLARVAKFSFNLGAATILVSAALYAITKYYSPEVSERLAKILNPEQMQFVMKYATKVDGKVTIATEAMKKFVSSLSRDQVDKLTKLYEKYGSVLIPTIPRELSLTGEKLELSKRYAALARNSLVSSAGLYVQCAKEKTTGMLGSCLSRAKEVVGRSLNRAE